MSFMCSQPTVIIFPFKTASSKFILLCLLSLSLASCKKDGPVDEKFPLPPSQLTAFATPEGVELTWTDNSQHETGFILERRKGGAAFKNLDTIAQNRTLYTDRSFGTDTSSYVYRIYAINEQSRSLTYSNEVTVKPLARPRFHIDIIGDSITNFDVRVNLNIEANSGTEILESGLVYGTFRRPTTETATIVENHTSGSTWFHLHKLKPATTYFIRGYTTNKQGTFYTEELSFQTLSGFSIGQYYKGGLIGYILQEGDAGFDPKVQHGLIISQSTGNLREWGCEGGMVHSAMAREIGSGANNTKAILDSCKTPGTAAKICSDWRYIDYDKEEFDDWYLPSAVEMLRLYANRRLLQLDPRVPYWTSTQHKDQFNQAYQVSIDGLIATFKSAKSNFRPIRSF